MTECKYSKICFVRVVYIAVLCNKNFRGTVRQKKFLLQAFATRFCEPLLSSETLFIKKAFCASFSFAKYRVFWYDNFIIKTRRFGND